MLELAMQLNEMELSINESTSNLSSFEVVGAYKESYYSGGSWSQVSTGRADAYLNVFLKNNGSDNIMSRV